MIFQLKMTLKGSKPPIWRRVEVRDSMNFYELHQVLQVAFGWGGFLLHGFQIKRSNGVNLDYDTSVGPVESDDFGFGDFKYDEKEVLLKEFFKTEKDRVLYIFDYRDNWEHDLVLEKILPELSGLSYPRCTKALRADPSEISRSDYFNTPIVTEEVDPTELANEINEILIEQFTTK